MFAVLNAVIHCSSALLPLLTIVANAVFGGGNGKQTPTPHRKRCACDSLDPDLLAAPRYPHEAMTSPTLPPLLGLHCLAALQPQQLWPHETARGHVARGKDS